MKRIKIIVGFAILGAMLFTLTGCSNKDSDNIVLNTSQNKTANSVVNTTNTNTTEVAIDYEANAQKQMSMPEEGEEIAIIKIKNFGDVKVKFFPEIAPKAVENFVTHSKNKYYDGLTFHRVINEFMIQGGDPDGNGTGGESIWGKGFGKEVDKSLVPFRGSLCMAMSSAPNSIGSQFFITQANYSESMESSFKNANYPEGLINAYKNYGGYLSLYLQYTVFGQVFEGMDVVDAVAKTEVTTSLMGEESVPVNDVVIESITITNYSSK